MATNEQLLSEAKTALHNLMTGQAVVEARDSSGEMVRYTRANASNLRAYIRELESLVANEGVRKARYPMRMQF